MNSDEAGGIGRPCLRLLMPGIDVLGILAEDDDIDLPGCFTGWARPGMYLTAHARRTGGATGAGPRERAMPPPDAGVVSGP